MGGARGGLSPLSCSRRPFDLCRHTGSSAFGTLPSRRVACARHATLISNASDGSTMPPAAGGRQWIGSMLARSSRGHGMSPRRPVTPLTCAGNARCRALCSGRLIDGWKHAQWHPRWCSQWRSTPAVAGSLVTRTALRSWRWWVGWRLVRWRRTIAVFSSLSSRQRSAPPRFGPTPPRCNEAGRFSSA